MKRLSCLILAVIPILASPFLYAVPVSAGQSVHLMAEYAKWGRLAMQETQKKYPAASIVDYLHVGRKTISQNTAEETFKFWLRQNQREWGVYVRIQFEPATEKLLSVTFQETSR